MENNTPISIDAICPKCGNQLSIPYPPIPIMNSVVVSIIAVPHTKGITCKCGAYYGIAITNTNIELGLAEMPKPILNEDKLIVPSSILPFPTKST